MLFNGNRVRKNGKDAEKAFFEAYFAWMKAFIAFTLGKKDFICDWRGKQDGAGAAAFFASQFTGSSAPAQAPTAAKEEVKTAPAPA